MQGFTWGDNPEVFHEILAREVGVAEQQVSQFFPMLFGGGGGGGGGDDDSVIDSDASRTSTPRRTSRTIWTRSAGERCQAEHISSGTDISFVPPAGPAHE